MSIDKDYVTSEELKATLELTGESFADDDVQLAITAASRSIDNACNRRFWLDADATTVRYYATDDPCLVRIDDLVDLNALATDPAGTGAFTDSWTAMDFVLYPLNAAVDGLPYTSIEIKPLGVFSFPINTRGVRVTGQFGWPTVPDPIKHATSILASKLLRRAREAPFGVVGIGLEGGSAMRITRNDPDVLTLIGPYMRGRIAVA